MKKLLSIVLAVLMVVSLVPLGVFAATSTGSAITANMGWYTDRSELIIDSVEDLWGFMRSGSNYAGQTVKLACDLDVNEGWIAGSRLAPANVWKPLDNFKGVFDGQGHEIRGLYIEGHANLGFVSNLYGTIKNLALVNMLVKATGNYIGSFAAHMEGSSCLISNVYTDAIVTGNVNVAGITYGGGSQNSGVMLEKCWFNGVVENKSNYSSGLYGNQESSVVTMVDCLNTGAVYATSNLAGISNAVYNGALHATNVVNLGPVQRSTATISGRGDASAIVNTLGSGSGNNEGNCKKCVWNGVYALEGTAGTVYPNDFRGSASEIVLNGQSFGKSTKANMASAMTITKGNLANEAAYKGLDFTNTWTMTAKGPVLKSFSEYSIITYIANADDYIAWAADTSDDTGTTVRLACDIYFVGGKGTENGNLKAKVALRGTFDGLGHVINGIHNGTLALVTDCFGTIRNLRVTNSSFSTATFAYYTFAGSVFENLYSNALIGASNHAGGIAGLMAEDGVTFRNCWFDGAVTVTNRYASGILGNHNNGHKNATFIDCLNTGLVASNTGSSDGKNPNTNICLAGISSAVYGGSGTTFTNCVNLGPIVVYNGLGIAEVDQTIAKGTYQTSGMSGNVSDINNVSFTNCYVLEGSCNYAAIGTLGVDYNVNIKRLTAAEKDDFAIAGWSKNETSEGVAVMAPSVFACFKSLDAVVAEKTYAKTVEIDSADALLKAMGNAGYTIPADTKFVLTADLDFTGKSWYDLNVSGLFDGQGHSIIGINTDAFFNQISSTGIVRNLKMYGKATHGGVAYHAYSGALLENIYCAVDVTGTTVAGFIHNNAAVNDEKNMQALSKPVVLSGCWYDGDIDSNTRYSSGFHANQQSCNFEFRDCLNTSRVTNRFPEGSDQWAAFSGSIYKGLNLFKDCVNMQTFVLNTSGKSYGMTKTVNGYGAARIDNCYNMVGSYTTHGTCESGGNNQKVMGMAQDFTNPSELTTKGLTNWAYSSEFGHLVPKYFADPIEENKYEITEYKKAGTYPVKEGYVFAGWFTDAECTTALSADVKTGTAYAKFVDEEVLSIYAQVRNDLDSTAAGKKAIRFVSTVDSLNFEEVGFEVVFGKSAKDANAKKFTSKAAKVYKTLVSGNELAKPSDLAEDATYFFAYTINNVPESAFNTAIGVRATWTTLDGTVVTSNYTGVTTINNVA